MNRSKTSLKALFAALSLAAATVSRLFGQAHSSPQEAWAAASVPMGQLTNFMSRPGAPAFVKVEGVVTYGREALFMRDGTDSLFCRGQWTTEFQPGDRLQVVGLVASNSTTVQLDDVQVRVLGRGPEPEPEKVRVADLLGAAFDAHLVRIVAMVIGDSGAAEDRAIVASEEDNVVFIRYRAGELPVVRPGSRIEATGIASLTKDYLGRPTNVRVVIRSPADLKILDGPPYWNASRLMFALVCVALSMALAAVWGWFMFNKAKRQGLILREQVFREAAAEARLGTVVESLAEGIVVQDAAGRTISSNTAASEILGLAAAQISGRAPVNPEWRTVREDGSPFPSADHPATATLRTGQPLDKVIMGIRRPDGVTRWISVNSRPLLDPRTKEISGVVTSFEDITRSRLQHRQLLEAHQRQKALLSAIPDLMILQSREGVYLDVYTNDPAQLVAPINEILGRNIAQFFPEHVTSSWRRCVDEAFRTGKVQLLEYAVDIAGRAEHFEARIVPCGDTLLNMVRNVTAQVAAREQHSALETRLQQAHKMEALGTFAGGIAHDFNNLLAVMLGNANLAREDLPQDHPASGSLDEILKACRRATDVVRQILAFSRKRGNHRETADVGPVVREVIEQLRQGAPSNIEWICSVSDPLNPASCAASEIHQMLTNLGSNAVQALAGSPGRIGFDVSEIADPSALGGTLTRLGHEPHLRIRVQDSGPGMDAATAERVFEPFFTTKGPGQGTGLGLAVVHGIAEAHHGLVVLDTAPGRGARFDIYLPAAHNKAGRGDAAAARPVPHGSGQRILVIDDEPAVGLSTIRLLRRAGFEGEQVSSPDTALQLLSGHGGFDLILSDWTMPGMNGIELAKAVRGCGIDVPIVIMTGFASGIRDDELRAANVKRLLAKPVDPEVLVRAIHHALAS